MHVDGTIVDEKITDEFVAKRNLSIGNPTIADAVLDRLVHNANASSCPAKACESNVLAVIAAATTQA
ncbi:hypothetical protein ATY79_18745 [Rhizobium sp. R693]|nr:hypothetical protein ATY79_18745 [Rhizobium sp. R693]